MTLTTDGILNVDISGTTINVAKASPGTRTVKAGTVAITTATNGTQLPNEPVSQGVTLYYTAAAQSQQAIFYIGGVSGNFAVVGGVQLLTSNNSPIIGTVTNLNQLSVISNVSGAQLAYFGVD